MVCLPIVSIFFKTILPLKPSQIMTSALSFKISYPSTLPIKFKLLSVNFKYASLLTRFPLCLSLPTERRATFGCAIKASLAA